MSLDLPQVAAQVARLVEILKGQELEMGHRLSLALEAMRSQSRDLDSLKKKIDMSRTTWLVAGVTTGLVDRTGPGACPAEYTVLATDGSHIDVDRHGPARCALINIGWAVLAYGGSPDADLANQPTLLAGDELTIANPNGNDQQRVEGGLLGIKRAVLECTALAALANGLSTSPPILALVDGSLIMWGLAGQAYPEYVKRRLLEREYLPAFDRMRETGASRGLALASYISFPRSNDVANVLRVALCPHDAPDCDRHCPGNATGTKKECEAIAGIQDSTIFSALLEPGERSATFTSRSSIVGDFYGKHEIRFFYLRTDDEVARVEFPRWVEDRGIVDMLHTLVLDQCRRGHGYPLALSEAHEQAVINSADREQFRHLVEAALNEMRLPTATSAKSRSKRTRWI